MGFIEVLRARGLVAQVNHEPELVQHLAEAPRTAYAGFDPTGDSLHIGHLLPVMVLAHMQRAGHRIIALLGGGTAMIADPTGKTELRQMLTVEAIDHNKNCIRKQIAHFLDFSSPERGLIRDNADWLMKLQYLPFLRDIGPHFSVNRMLTADCFKLRLEKGLSFLEFNYMLLQSYDFLHLFREENCSIQLGGDDQWSNMLAGADLIRRLESRPAFCFTLPLLQTSDGKKMGKTEKGAVWLDEAQTSAYEYFQYWRNIEDELAIPCLRYFTFMPNGEIDKLAQLTGSEINEAKKVLAFETTKLLHGEEKAMAARTSAESLFTAHSGAAGSEPTTDFTAQEFSPGMGVADFLVRLGAGASKGEIRRLIEQGGFTINGEKVADLQRQVTLSDFKGVGGCLVKKGRKHYYRGRIS